MGSYSPAIAMHSDSEWTTSLVEKHFDENDRGEHEHHEHHHHHRHEHRGRNGGVGGRGGGRGGDGRKPSFHSDRIFLAGILALALIAPFSLVSFQNGLPTSIFGYGGRGFHNDLKSREFMMTITRRKASIQTTRRFEEALEQCRQLPLIPGPPADFGKREESDRYVPDVTKTIWIENATIWTGGDNGHEILREARVLLDKGIIKHVGKKGSTPDGYKLNATDRAIHIEAMGAWLTPGIFDMHSHIGVESAPALSGAQDGNSRQKPVLPYLRSLDSINTHDASYLRTVSGGVTTSLILPGSANNVGGQAFVVKLRKTKEKTTESMVLEMPWNVVTGTVGKKQRRAGDPPRWRHMKMACGENIRRVYSQTRLDLAWNFRSAFEQARNHKIKQDKFCEKAFEVEKKGLILADSDDGFPEVPLEWEALVDVLRGKVKVNTHCYESTDFSAFVRHTNEFEFPVAAFHHAHEAYIVPDLLKTAWNSTPAVAIFATNARYKREAWRGSEYAAKILSENNITVIMKSDHPVLDSRYLLFEAQQAHHFGLPENLALASVTTNSAKTAGFGHRLGLVKTSYDADLVLWDSHPLKLGATPLQVFVDGIPQLEHPYPAKEVETGDEAPLIATMPKHPITLQDDDDSLNVRLDQNEKDPVDDVLFTNVAEVMLKEDGKLTNLFTTAINASLTSVRVKNGEIICIGASNCELSHAGKAKVIDLKGGSLLPPLIGYGPALGLTEIISERSTTDGAVYDPLFSGELSRTQQLWGPTVAVRAIDGLAFGGKHLRIAHASGVMKAITAPMGEGFFRGVSVAFRTDAKNILDKTAIIKDIVALHVTIGHYKATQTPSISTEIAELRGLLLGGLKVNLDGQTSMNRKQIDDGPTDYFALAAQGQIPLVINAWKADVMATLILLKKEIESASVNIGTAKDADLKWIIHGGQEAHLVAKELAEAQISVVLSPPRAFPESWDERRAIPGPPLTPRTAANILHNEGVLMALGVPQEWQAQSLLWEAAWAQKGANGEVDRKDAIGWLSTNLEKMFDLPTSSSGFESDRTVVEFVAYERDPFDFGSRPVAASSGNGHQIVLL